MPRRRRIYLVGMPRRIVQRRHNCDACFFYEQDYQSYLRWPGEALNKARAQFKAYALMTHHVQLLVTPASGESAHQLIVSLGRRYV